MTSKRLNIINMDLGTRASFLARADCYCMALILKVLRGNSKHSCIWHQARRVLCIFMVIRILLLSKDDFPTVLNGHHVDCGI